VPRFEQMNLGIGDFPPEGQGAFEGEQRVVLAPYDQGRRTVFPQVRLPGRIGGDVGLIVVHEFDLNALHPGAAQKRKFIAPGVGVDKFWDVTRVTLTCNLRGVQRAAQGVFMGQAVVPECLAGIPGGGQTLEMDHGVLDDQRCDPFGVSQGQTETHGAAVVLKVERITRYAQLFDEPADTFSQVVEGIGKLLGRWRVTVSEAGIVRRDHPVAVGQTRSMSFLLARNELSGRTYQRSAVLVMPVYLVG
jgi:hypothetical protein